LPPKIEKIILMLPSAIESLFLNNYYIPILNIWQGSTEFSARLLCV
jgi:hypothetical protein